MFTFLSGRPCLDLTTTLQVRHHEHPRELLNTPPDVTRWLSEAGYGPGIAVDDAGLRRTIALRETVDSLCRRGASSSQRADLNAVASQPPLVVQWTDSGVAYRGDLGQALSTVARDAIDLLAGPYASRVRECAHPDCSRLFLDASHAGRRRWCGMSACGTKAKSASYRRRRAALG